MVSCPTATGTGTRQVQESIREVWSETTPDRAVDPVLTQDDCEARTQLLREVMAKTPESSGFEPQ